MSLDFLRQKQRLRSGVTSDGRPSLTYTLGYLVKSDSQTELSVADVLSALGLRPGSPFGEDPNATLQDVDIDRLSTLPPHCRWTVDIIYATNAKVPENDSNDPTQMRVKMSKRFAELGKYIIADKNGNLALNSAKEPFKGGVPVSTFPNTFVYEWRRNVPTRGFHGTVNLNQFNGCDPGTLLCLITSELQYEGAWIYWHETIEMRYDPDGWNPKPANAGFKQRQWLDDGSDYTIVDCLDDNKQPFSDPQPLYDATADEDWVSGPKLEGTMIPVSARPADCVYVTVDHFTETQFEKIGVREFPE